MLRPSKFTNLDNSLLSVVCSTIEILLKVNKISNSNLYDELKKIYGDSIDYYYILCLDFLFLLGKISYCKNSDSLELIK